MSESVPAAASRAVFLSYASQDAEAARRICAALRAAGVTAQAVIAAVAWWQPWRRVAPDSPAATPGALVAPVAEGRRTMRHGMRVDARMAPFRDDLEIVALLAEPGVKP